MVTDGARTTQCGVLPGLLWPGEPYRGAVSGQGHGEHPSHSRRIRRRLAPWHPIAGAVQHAGLTRGEIGPGRNMGVRRSHCWSHLWLETESTHRRSQAVRCTGLGSIADPRSVWRLKGICQPVRTWKFRGISPIKLMIRNMCTVTGMRASHPIPGAHDAGLTFAPGTARRRRSCLCRTAEERFLHPGGASNGRDEFQPLGRCAGEVAGLPYSQATRGSGSERSDGCQHRCGG